MQEALTARQAQIFAFVKDRQRETGMIPTIQETAKHFGFKSLNSAQQHFRLIEKKGFIQRLPGISRGLIVAQSEGGAYPESIRVPLLGRIQAGKPALANEFDDAMLTLPADLFRGSGLFALKVRGTSMEGAGILDRDIAVIDSMAEVKDGVVAAVLIEDEATLKRVYRRTDGLLLKAENPMFQDIEVSGSAAERTRVLGALIGIVRKI
jgi:repressor LexA